MGMRLEGLIRMRAQGQPPQEEKLSDHRGKKEVFDGRRKWGSDGFFFNPSLVVVVAF